MATIISETLQRGDYLLFKKMQQLARESGYPQPPTT